MNQPYASGKDVPEPVRTRWRELYRTRNCVEVAELHHPDQRWEIVRSVVAPPRSKGVDPETAAEWRRRDRAGESLQSIARSTHWAYSTVQRHCRGDGAPESDRNPPSYDRGWVVDRLPSREEVLAHPERQWSEWAEVLDVPVTRLTTLMSERGWHREMVAPNGPGASSPSRLSHAPCAGCGESVPVEDLDGDECSGCLAPADEALAPGVTRADLEAEREAYLRRRRTG